MESKSKQLFSLIRSIQIDYEKIDANVIVLGKHINNAYSQFGNVSTGFFSLGQKIHSTKTLKDDEEKQLKD